MPYIAKYRIPRSSARDSAGLIFCVITVQEPGFWAALVRPLSSSRGGNGVKVGVLVYASGLHGVVDGCDAI